MRAKRSTKVWDGARCACACSTRWMMRASVVSRRNCVTRTSRAPRPLMLPANTSSPGPLSTGSDSPVTGAWLTALTPSMTTPSSGSFSPGFTMMTEPGAIELDRHAALGGAVPDERLGGRRGRSARERRDVRARASALRASARRRTGTRPPPPSDHWPSATAPAAATSMRTLMSSDRCLSAIQALRAVSGTPDAMDAA